MVQAKGPESKVAKLKLFLVLIRLFYLNFRLLLGSLLSD